MYNITSRSASSRGSLYHHRPREIAFRLFSPSHRLDHRHATDCVIFSESRRNSHGLPSQALPKYYLANEREHVEMVC
jgi:hypothetical protein